MKRYLNPFYESTRYADKRVALGVTGSIACYKACELLRAFHHLQIKISATLTDSATRFISPLLFKSLGAETVYNQLFNDLNVFAHLEPGINAEAFVISPATANFISKITAGIADDMLSCQCLAYDGKLLLAPAMNPFMWKNQATQENIRILKNRNIVIIPPQKGLMACGSEGTGRLANQDEIFLNVLKALSPQDMTGLKVMVTLGPTREPWDGLRFLSNPSSGVMGSALSTCCWLRGAQVTAISGPIDDIYFPESINYTQVETASEMLQVASKVWPEMDIGIFCAAVADFAPILPENEVKIKKDNNISEIRLVRTHDILATLSSCRKPSQKILGFAAEIVQDINDLLPFALKKLHTKNIDIVAANRVNKDAQAFGYNNNSMLVVDKNGTTETWTSQSKADIAWELCTWLLKI